MDPSNLCLIHIENILENVVSSLPAVEAVPKKEVCRAWQIAIDKVLQKRAKHNAFDSRLFISDRCKRSLHEGMLMTESKRMRLSADVCQLENFRETFFKWRKEWQQTPKIVILVCKSVKATGETFSHLSNKIYDIFQKHLPKDCALVMLRGSMCCQMDNLNFTLRTEVLSVLSSRSNEVNIMSWTCMSTEKDKKLLLSAIKSFAFCQKDLKMLLFFFDISKGNVTRWITNKFKNFLKNDLKLSDDVVILGCALHDRIQVSKNCSDTMLTLEGNHLKGVKRTRMDESSKNAQFLAIAIHGKAVSATSLLVESHVNTILELNDEIQLLKSAAKTHPGRNNFGIIVSCIDRMHDTFWYEDYVHTEEGVERNAFQQAFPSMPIISMHGFGEIGNNYNLNVPSHPIQEMFSHAGAAIFTVVSFGDP